MGSGPPELLVPSSGPCWWAVTGCCLGLQELAGGGRPCSNLGKLALEGQRAWRWGFQSDPGSARRGKRLYLSTVGVLQRVLEFEGTSGLLRSSSLHSAAASLTGGCSPPVNTPDRLLKRPVSLGQPQSLESASFQGALPGPLWPQVCSLEPHSVVLHLLFLVTAPPCRGA